MEIFKTILFIGLFFAPPQLLMNWAGGNKDGVKIVASGTDESVVQCAKSGLEVRYRYEERLCRRRSTWFDSCASPRVDIRSLQFDPISEIYTVMSDRLDDVEAPRISKFTSLNEALQQTSTISYLPLSFLDRDGLGPQGAQNAYVSVRLRVQCRGSLNETLEKLSYFLTLGLIRSHGYDSGWMDFQLGAG